MVSHDFWARKRKTVFHGNWNGRAWKCRFRIPLPDPTAVLISYLSIKFQYFKVLKFAVQRPRAPLSAKQCVWPNFQAQGAATVVYCATSRELNRVGGHYFNNCSVCLPSEEAKNPDIAATLWQLSEQLVRQITSNEEPVVNLELIQQPYVTWWNCCDP